MNIFINLPFEFMRKIVLFYFGMTKFIFMIYDCSYITFMIVSIINKNMIMKYIILYWISLNCKKKNYKTTINLNLKE